MDDVNMATECVAKRKQTDFECALYAESVVFFLCFM